MCRDTSALALGQNPGAVQSPPILVDAHLDLAYNVARGRDLRSSVATIRSREQATREQCMVTLPEMAKAGVALAGASIFTKPVVDARGEPIFSLDVEADGKRQLDVYRQWEEEGLVRLVRGRRALREHLAAWRQDLVPGLILAMESADPIRSPDELGSWFAAGVRMIGPAWGPTRYCGGFTGETGRPTPLTDLGRELVAAMIEQGVILDLAHMSMESCWESLESAHPHVALTHTTPRQMVGIDRFPDDAVLQAIANRGGVVGIGLGNVFFDRAWWDHQHNHDPVTLGAVERAFRLAARAAGWDHVGIGSDLDGGIGVEESPVELDTIADIRRVADVVPEEAAAGVLGGNWLRFFEAALPD